MSTEFIQDMIRVGFNGDWDLFALGWIFTAVFNMVCSFRRMVYVSIHLFFIWLFTLFATIKQTLFASVSPTFLPSPVSIQGAGPESKPVGGAGAGEPCCSFLEMACFIRASAWVAFLVHGRTPGFLLFSHPWWMVDSGPGGPKLG